MKYRRRLDVVITIVGIFTLIFSMLARRGDAPQTFARLGININFISSLILGSILFYWTFEARAYKRSLLESIACFLLSISSFLLAICSYYTTWKFSDISLMIIIVLSIVASTIFWQSSIGIKKLQA
ncbi:hypothetical protein [Aminipila terrae]|uniref:Uncharacterized protein n=1 Tax=Aminipila terrae TaxID=2697030 RepID=A0A6P1MEP1_9FIRM|nr:hypothetical protein [Aminipila terrae]QHI72492.1 hypothetical protein Ami3637_08875 [Aminipila terrae]